MNFDPENRHLNSFRSQIGRSSHATLTQYKLTHILLSVPFLGGGASWTYSPNRNGQRGFLTKEENTALAFKFSYVLCLLG